ncbi:rhodanese-like domain-containing protein 10 isoform X1 [Tripterygium wilfordii]|uniref:Rhodanese-like domain-containing protein 10 isoform X1 n=1 Tax=Tripterygium wilfordii TaxID=458696 RepID=A0A7J7DMV9_TRIWF|nr:rhodanese-like domain-containing protein 10 [Tripterygium wilfordii]KAF5747623.1 rhodanese-like domain-containing protein 10 isoform X1 [Tripterygium wilfordii]
MAIQLNQLYIPTLKYGKQPPKLHISTARGSNTFIVNAASTSARQLIQSGVVRPILPKDAAKAVNSEGFSVLDIRPVWEREKASVTGSLHVPLFIEDPDTSPITLLKKWVHFGYIGLWTGQKFTMLNPNFLADVEAASPGRENKLIVACGEGLRSMMAVSKLHEEGYKNLGWLAGGFSRAAEDDFPVEGTEKLQYATVGGASYYFLQLLILLQAVGSKSP